MTKTCENKQRLGPGFKLTVCKDKATTTRKHSRFGDKSKGEPLMVDETIHLCDFCAELWDEAIREMEWEARVS
jgi:hypothetical protein